MNDDGLVRVRGETVVAETHREVQHREPVPAARTVRDGKAELLEGVPAPQQHVRVDERDLHERAERLLLRVRELRAELTLLRMKFRLLSHQLAAGDHNPETFKELGDG